MNSMPANYLWLIPLLPFAGFLINGTLGRRLPRGLVSAVALLFTAAPACLVAWLWSTMLGAGAPEVLHSAAQTWISITAAGRGSGRVGFGDDVAAGAGLVVLGVLVAWTVVIVGL